VLLALCLRNPIKAHEDLLGRLPIWIRPWTLTVRTKMLGIRVVRAGFGLRTEKARQSQKTRMQTDRFVALVEIPDEFVGMIRWDCQGSDGDSALGYYAGEGQGTMVRGQSGFLRGLWFHLMLVLVLVLVLTDFGSGKTDLSQGFFDKSWVDGAGSILWVSANGPANSDPIRFESA